MVNNRDELQRNMFAAYKKQKDLIRKRDSLLDLKTPQEKQESLQITHEIAKLEDFIRMAENTLRMTD